MSVQNDFVEKPSKINIEIRVLEIHIVYIRPPFGSFSELVLTPYLLPSVDHLQSLSLQRKLMENAEIAKARKSAVSFSRIRPSTESFEK